jgi:DNA-binding NarL/FixJ family response regulator
MPHRIHRILLADDAPVVRRAVKSLLEREGFEVIGEAADGEEAIRLAQALNPDVVVLDMSMPRLNGLDAAREIHRTCPRIHMILLTLHSEEDQIVRAFWVGIRGYVVKSEAAEDLARAVEEVCRGDTFMSRSVSRVVARAYVPRTNCPVFGGRPMVPCEICGLCPPDSRDTAGPASTD